MLPDGEEKWAVQDLLLESRASAFVLFSVYGGLTWLGVLPGLSSSIVSNRTTLGQAPPRVDDRLSWFGDEPTDA